jgi:4-diphosphocytidyl-2-C-methyl-D-erythritol kinase
LPSPRTVRVFAPAKINLTLHVTGRRPDGYHVLDSLVAFASVGDWLILQDSDELRMRVGGPMAEGVPTGEDNLVVQAARFLGQGRGASITLNKHLPTSSGMGGGSADAAAAMRGLWRLWRLPPPDGSAAEGIVRLGADVPVCLMSAPARMRGIGERVSRVEGFPEAYVVLVNPGVKIDTAAVFRDLTNRENPAMPETLPRFRSAEELASFLREQRNDLEPLVVGGVKQVARTLKALQKTSGVLVSRMTGSGATCFGLYATEAEAKAAAEQVRRPDWWVGGGLLYADEAAARPETVS